MIHVLKDFQDFLFQLIPVLFFTQPGGTDVFIEVKQKIPLRDLLSSPSFLTVKAIECAKFQDFSLPLPHRLWPAQSVG